MTRSVRLAALTLGCAAGTLLAQTPEEPQLVFSLAAGIAAGRGSQWSLTRQPVQVLVQGSTELDTLGVGRYLRPGIALALGATYYRSRHLGFTAEAGYFGVASEQRCTPPMVFKTDAEEKNRVACAAMQGAHVQTSLVGFLAGITFRLAPAGRVQPYARLIGGVGLLASSFVRSDATIQFSSCQLAGNVCTIVFVDGESTPEAALLASLAAGATFEFSSGYRFRFEARDLVVALPVPAGNANSANALAPVERRWRHTPVFTAGLDVVLERRRGRRY